MQRPVSSSVDLNYDYYPQDEENGGSALQQGSDTEDDDIMEVPPPSARWRSRKSIRGESFNPEQFLQSGFQQKIVHPKSDQQRERLLNAVKLIFLFRSLDREQLEEVLDAMFERKVQAGDFVIQEGDDGDYFYVIESGAFNVYLDNNGGPRQHVGGYNTSGSFGELALMYSMPRAATIQAGTNGSLWALDCSTFRRIVVSSAYQKRRTYEDLLASVPLLKALTAYERMNLADALTTRSFDDGHRVIRQGDAADGMYFVENGTVTITVTGKQGKETVVSQTGNGGYFGELALVTQRARAASVCCQGPVRLAFLDAQAFERLLGPCMDIMKRNMADYESQLLRIFGTI